MLMFFTSVIGAGFYWRPLYFVSRLPLHELFDPCRWTSVHGSAPLQLKSRALTTPMDYERRTFS
jgi:hypothetical protein